MDNTFQCFLCRGTFAKGRTDEEAVADMQRDFPGFDIDDCEMLCGDCYTMVMKEVEDGQEGS